jgi:hypothetical protein
MQWPSHVNAAPKELLEAVFSVESVQKLHNGRQLQLRGSRTCSPRAGGLEYFHRNPCES